MWYYNTKVGLWTDLVDSITFKFMHKTILSENDIKWLRMIGCMNRVISYDSEQPLGVNFP